MKPKVKTGICKLCLEDKNLISKSHILPKFLLKRILNKDSKGFVVMSFDTKHSTHVFDHNYESGLLCSNCDNKILSSYEDYGSKFLYGNLGKKDALKISQKEIHFEVENVDYQKLKMFFLSILWKCSISSLYTSVKLKSSTEEYLRDIILNNKYLTEQEFPIILWNYSNLKDVPKEFILPPYISKKIKNEKNFHLLGGGFFVQIVLEYGELSAIIQESMLKDSGTINVISVPDFQMKKIINKLVGWNWLK